MAEEIITVREPNAAPGFGHVDLAHLLQYEEIIAKVIALWKSVTTLAVGASSKLTVVKVHIGGGEYVWDLGSIKREK